MVRFLHGFPGSTVFCPYIEQALDAVLGGIQQAQQQMLHGNELILHVIRPILGGNEGLVQVIADIDFVRLPGAGDPGELAQLRLGSSLKALHGDVHFPQQLGNQSALLLQQGRQQMDLLQLLVIVPNRQILRALNSFLGFLRKVLKIHSDPSFPVLALSYVEC